MPRPTAHCFALFAVTALAISPCAQAQTASKAAKSPSSPPSASSAPVAAGFHIEGFRSAKFGMTQDEVKAAIAKDFNIQPSAVIMSTNPIDQTTSLSVKVDHLDPGPGIAGVSYIFGATKKNLMHVNVVWTTGAAPTNDERKSIVTAGLQLGVYFQGQSWPANRTVAAALTKNGFLIFGAIDAQGSGVEITTIGVPLESADPKAPKPADPTGPAQLLIAYSADHDHPDLARIPQGAF